MSEDTSGNEEEILEEGEGEEEGDGFDIIANYNDLPRSAKIEVLTQLSRRCRSLANLHTEYERARTESERAAIAFETEQQSLLLVQLLAEYNIAIPNSEFFEQPGE